LLPQKALLLLLQKKALLLLLLLPQKALLLLLLLPQKSLLLQLMLPQKALLLLKKALLLQLQLWLLMTFFTILLHRLLRTSMKKR
jgi:hypothetical protein